MQRSSPRDRFTLTAIILLAVLSVLGWAASAPGQMAGPEVYQALEKSPKVRVVIALRPPTAAPTDQPAVMAEIQVMQSKVLAPLSTTDFTLTHRWDTMSAIAGEVSRSGLEKLLADPEVVRIDLDVGGGASAIGQGAQFVRAYDVQAAGLTGQGVTVAVLDTGIDTNHPDLSGALVAEQCFCTTSTGAGCCPNQSTQQSGAGSAEDDNGHGTNVAGIIASAGILAPLGVAPKAKLVAIKVLDSQGRTSSSSQVISALNWVITNRPDVRVVNMSLGSSQLFTGTCDNSTAWTMTYAQAINTLKSKGVLVFAPSGNGGSETQMAAPACLANAASVGAVYALDVGSVATFGCTDSTTAADKVTCFSNSSSTLSLMAPGAPITSAGKGGTTSTYYGTSQASPHAAGGAALALELNPGLTPDQILTTLKDTGVPITDPKNGLIFPRIDLLAAMKSLDTSGPARTNGQPTGVLAAGTTQTTISLTTHENATCKYGSGPNTPYVNLPATFSTTGGANHSTPVGGLQVGRVYPFYVRCQDALGNPNPDDYRIVFAIAPRSGDFNGDGRTDLLWQNQSTGAVIVWYLDGTTILGSPYLYGGGLPDWKVVGSADFNGDGKADLLWQNQTTGAVIVWYMDGATLLDSKYLYQGGLPDWKVVGSADFNGDGKADLLWQNQTTGAVIVWYMDGTTILGSPYLYQGGFPDWKVVGPR